MKNLLTGTSTEVTWLHTVQVGAAALLLSPQTQAEISPVSSGQAATPQLLPKSATHLSHLSLLLSCWTPCPPKATCVNAGQALLQAGDHRISSAPSSSSEQQVTVTAGQRHRSSGRCSRHLETKERISGFSSTSYLKSPLWGSTWHWHRARTPCSHHESNIHLIILIRVL